MQELRQRKQQYLRQNVLERNYDAEDFIEFCYNTKGNTEIDAWTYQQLVEMVKEFIAQVDKQRNAQQQEFTEFSQPPPKVSSQVEDQFNNWSGFHSATLPQKPPQNTFNLNLVDFDFLEGLGSPKVQSKKQDTFHHSAKELKTPHSTGVFDKNVMIIPGDVAKKLQAGNDSFIVGYNKPEQKTEIAKKRSLQKQKQKVLTQSPRHHQDSHSVEHPSPKKEGTKVMNLPGTDDFELELNTRKVTSKSKLTGNQQAVVSGHEIINPNVFVPNYVMYTITINPLNIQVKRRAKDLQAMRALLKKMFPAVQLPYLETSGRLSETEPSVIKKQKIAIESFLNNLILNDRIRCKLLDDFLLCQDQALLKKIIKQHQRCQKAKAIEDLYTHEGKVKLKYDSMSKKFIEQQTTYLDYLQNNFTKLKGLYDQVMGSLLHTNKLLTQIAEVYETLTENTKTINSSFAITYQSIQLERTFAGITTLTKQWAQGFKTQAKILENDIRHTCRFESYNTETMREIVRMHDTIATDNYSRRADKSEAQKYTYESSKLADYKTSLQYPSRNILVLKYQAGYIQQQTVSEFKRYFADLSRKLNQKYHLFSVEQLNVNNDLDNAWKHFLSSFPVG